MSARKIATATAVLAALLVSGLLVAATSHAAFTATTQTGTSSFRTASVKLDNDHAGMAVFDASGIVPGQRGSQDVEVTYTGEASVDVRMYTAASDVDEVLAEQLRLTVTEENTTVFTGTMEEFAAVTDFASAPSVWEQDGDGSRVYTIAWELPESAGDAVQGTTADLTFGWEAHSVA